MFDDADAADAYVHAVARDWRTAPLSDADRALCVVEHPLTLSYRPSPSPNSYALDLPSSR